MDNNKSTLVIGASPNPSRYSFLATQRLRGQNHFVIPFGIKKGEIAGMQIQNDWPEGQTFHTVTLYIGPKLQPDYYDRIIALKPERVIFNPGTENPEFEVLLQEAHIETLNACNLVMLSAGTY